MKSLFNYSFKYHSNQTVDEHCGLTLLKYFNALIIPWNLMNYYNTVLIYYVAPLEIIMHKNTMTINQKQI